VTPLNDYIDGESLENKKKVKDCDYQCSWTNQSDYAQTAGNAKMQKNCKEKLLNLSHLSKIRCRDTHKVCDIF